MCCASIITVFLSSNETCCSYCDPFVTYPLARNTICLNTFQKSKFYFIPCQLSFVESSKVSLVFASGCWMFLLCHWILFGSRMHSTWKAPLNTNDGKETSVPVINATGKNKRFLMFGWPVIALKWPTSTLCHILWCVML